MGFWQSFKEGYNSVGGNKKRKESTEPSILSSIFSPSTDICRWCGREYDTSKYSGHSHYCSNKCAYEANLGGRTWGG